MDTTEVQGRLAVSAHLAMTDIDAAAWDALAGDASPFLRHAFLLALEQSGCVTAATGWAPRHILVHDDDGLVAALPLYAKTHSWGEYVFDWGWADAYRRHGHPYYPKLLTAVPYTPSPAPRLLLRGGLDAPRRAALFRRLYEEVTRQVEELGASSWHVLFPEADECARWEQQGLIRREACQFHWHNRGYGDFEDFLAQMSSRKRKNLRREREEVARGGFRFVCLEGPALSEADWDTFYRFYQNTYHVRGQEAYLNREFFARIGATMAEQLFLVMAQKDDVYVAGALFFRNSHTLYGRYWGSDADYYNLHFETCYYQGIDYCLRHGLQRFDAGAQGEHKLRRGFEPEVTLSCHWIAEPAFRDAIANFCADEAEHMALYREHAAGSLPFRRD